MRRADWFKLHSQMVFSICLESPMNRVLGNKTQQKGSYGHRKYFCVISVSDDLLDSI